MVEPASEVDGIADEIQKERDLVGRPAYDESTADHQWRDCSIASSCYHYFNRYKFSPGTIFLFLLFCVIMPLTGVINYVFCIYVCMYVL